MNNIKNIIFGVVITLCTFALPVQGQVIFTLDQFVYATGSGAPAGDAKITLTDLDDNIQVTYDLSAIDSGTQAILFLFNSVYAPADLTSTLGSILAPQFEQPYTFQNSNFEGVLVGGTVTNVIFSHTGGVGLDVGDFLLPNENGDYVRADYWDGGGSFSGEAANSYTVVPEPGTYLLLGSTLALVAVARRRKELLS